MHMPRIKTPVRWCVKQRLISTGQIPHGNMVNQGVGRIKPDGGSYKAPGITERTSPKVPGPHMWPRWTILASFYGISHMTLIFVFIAMHSGLLLTLQGVSQPGDWNITWYAGEDAYVFKSYSETWSQGWWWGLNLVPEMRNEHEGEDETGKSVEGQCWVQWHSSPF